LRSPGLEAAVIRATSHDERSVDYGSTSRVFALARTSPPTMQLLMWALVHWAGRTQCWAVVLKVLMLVHGLLLRSDLARHTSAASPSTSPTSAAARRRRPSHRGSPRSCAHTLLPRHLLPLRRPRAGRCQRRSRRRGRAARPPDQAAAPTGPALANSAIWGRHGKGLVLEAMDCVVIEIFEVYS
ncbi:hypothetical protein BAE44_0018290, partial [Dichanthelium oligosanthes]